MKTNSEILKTFDCPEQAVKHNGVWMWPEELDVPKEGDIRWSKSAQSPCRASHNYTDIFLIFRAIPIPPKPTPLQLAKITPAGKVATLGEDVDDCSAPFVGWHCGEIVMDGDGRDYDKIRSYGLRWPVTLTDTPNEPVKRWVKCTRNGALRAIAAFEAEKCVSIDCNDGSVTKILSDTGYSSWSLDTLISESEYNRLKAEWTGKKVKAEPVAVEAEPVETVDLLLLKLRNVIADKEFATAHANRQLDLGGWTQDWNHEQQINDCRIEELIKKIDAVNELRAK